VGKEADLKTKRSLFQMLIRPKKIVAQKIVKKAIVYGLSSRLVILFFPIESETSWNNVPIETKIIPSILIYYFLNENIDLKTLKSSLIILSAHDKPLSEAGGFSKQLGLA